MTDINKQITDFFTTNFSEDEIESAKLTVQTLGVTLAIKNSGCVFDLNVVADQLFKDKAKAIPMRVCKDVVDNLIPIMIENEEIVITPDERIAIHPELLSTAMEYEEMLEDQRGTLPPRPTGFPALTIAH